MIPTTAAYNAEMDRTERHPVLRVTVDWERDGHALDDTNRVIEPALPAGAAQLGAQDGYACPQVLLTSPLGLSWDDTSVLPGGIGYVDLVAPLAPGKTYQCSCVVTVDPGSPPVRWGDMFGDDWVESTTTGSPEVLTVAVTASATTVIGWFTAPDPGAGVVSVHDPSISGPDTLDDLTGLVTAVTVTQAINTDLPDVATGLAGESVTSAQVELGGDPADGDRSAAALFSPYNSASAYYGLRRRDVPIRIDLGYMVAGDEGDEPELLPVWTGRTDNLVVDGVEGTVTIPAVDGTGAMTGRPMLPQVVGLDNNVLALMRPGLNSQWIIAELAAQAGYHAVPPPRPDCVLHASMLGSLAARSGHGELTTAVYQDDDDGDGNPDDEIGLPVPYAQDPDGFGLRPVLPAGTWYAATWTLGGSGIRQRSGDSWLLQMWLDVPAEPNVWDLPEHSFGVASGDDLWSVSLRLQVADGTGAISMDVVRGGDLETITPLVGQAIAPGRHYVAVYGAHPDNTSISTVWRLDDEMATDSTSGLTSAAAAPAMTVAVVQGSTGSSAVQVTAEHNGPAGDPFIRWDQAFVPTAYLEAGLAELTAIPVSDVTDAGALLREVVAAEYGTLIVGTRQTQRDVLQFWNRRHWSEAPEALTVARTLTATRHLLELCTLEPANAVRNVIRAPLRPLFVLPAGRVWEYTGQPLRVPPRGTRRVWADFGGDSVYQLDTTLGIIPSGGADATSGSGYRAARRGNGDGGEVTNLTVTVTPFATTALIEISNPNSFEVFLVSPRVTGAFPGGTKYPPSSDGKNALQLVGRRITRNPPSLDTDVQDMATASTPVVEVRNQGSIDQHGEEYELTLPQSPWRQSTADAEDLCRDLLRVLATPAPQMVPVTIVADPSVQLGDRVHLQDPTGMLLDDPFWVVAETQRFDGADAFLGAVVALRPVARPGQGIWGVTGRNIMGVSTF